MRYRLIRLQPLHIRVIMRDTDLLAKPTIPLPLSRLVADSSAKHGLLIFCAWDSYNNSDF